MDADGRATSLHRRLEGIELLDEDAMGVLDELLARRRSVPAGTTLQEEGASIDRALFLLSGWAMRCRSLADGQEQVINLLVPGDVTGLSGALFRRSLARVEVLTDAVVAEFPARELIDRFRRSPRTGAALCWISAQDERFVAQQLMRVGRLAAPRRIAHLLSELLVRRRLAGATEPDARVVPLTQTTIADALGMSHVHANRSCRELVRRELVSVSPARIEILDEGGLADLAHFDADYLFGGGLPRGAEASLDAGGTGRDGSEAR